MIPSIAYIVAAYAVARLIQVPLQEWEPESPGQRNIKSLLLVVVSVVAVAVVVICAGSIHEASGRIGDRLDVLK